MPTKPLRLLASKIYSRLANLNHLGKTAAREAVVVEVVVAEGVVAVERERVPMVRWD